LTRLANIDEEIAVSGSDEELITSHLASFEVIENKSIFCSFVKCDDKHKSSSGNKEKIRLELTGMHYAENNRSQASLKKSNLLKDLKVLLADRFADLQNEVMENMKWFDPANWTNNRTYDTDQLSFLAEYFEKPLKATNFDSEGVAKEWKSL
jgi:hypothetical protein